MSEILILSIMAFYNLLPSTIDGLRGPIDFVLQFPHRGKRLRCRWPASGIRGKHTGELYVAEYSQQMIFTDNSRLY